MRVGVQQALHCALREQRPQLAPQAPPSTATAAAAAAAGLTSKHLHLDPAPAALALPPGVPWQAVALSAPWWRHKVLHVRVGAPVARRHSRAGDPGLLVHVVLAVLVVVGVVVGSLMVQLVLVVLASASGAGAAGGAVCTPLGTVVAKGPRQRATVRTVTRHATAVAVHAVGRLLQVESGQRALQRAKGLVGIQAGLLLLLLLVSGAAVPLVGRGPEGRVFWSEHQWAGGRQATVGLLEAWSG